MTSFLQLIRWLLYPIQVGTFKFKTLGFAPPPPPPTVVLLRRVSGASFLALFSAFLSEVLLRPEAPRRTCQTGLLRPKWTPPRPGLAGHFLVDLDSPVELLLEHGALFTFRVPGAPKAVLGRVHAFPADLLRENGHRFMFSSAELAPAAAPPPLFRSFFSFSPPSLFFLNMSLHRFEAVITGAPVDTWASGAEIFSGSGRGFGSGGFL